MNDTRELIKKVRAATNSVSNLRVQRSRAAHVLTLFSGHLLFVNCSDAAVQKAKRRRAPSEERRVIGQMSFLH